MIFRKIILFLIVIQFIFAEDITDSCIIDSNNRNFDRFQYTYPQFIDGPHIRVHFTTEAVDSFFFNNSWFTHQSNLVYATTVLDQVEYSYSVYEDEGWQMPPPDCDESITDVNNSNHCINYGGNTLYDVYIGVVQGPAAAVPPENPYSELPYLGANTSYMLFANGLGAFGSYDDLLSYNYHIAAHEMHHAVEFSYGSYATGPPGNQLLQSWMLEQTATYMENVVYPNSMHLRIMLGNCDATTPLTSPELGINMAYAGALWQKYLVETLEDSSVIRQIWESYGSQISNSNEPVSFFSIFNDIILDTSDNTMNLEDAYIEYSIWRFFTGDRAIPNQYFEESASYCTTTTIPMPEDDFQFLSNLGTTLYIEIPNADLTIHLESDHTEYLPAILISKDMNEDYSMTEFNLLDGNNHIDIDESFEGDYTLIITSGYSADEFENVTINMGIYSAPEMGDINGDGSIDVLDVVILINFILQSQFPSDQQQDLSDINSDGVLNVLDVVQLINTILSGS